MVRISIPRLPVEYQTQTHEMIGPEIIELEAKAFIFDKDGTLLTHDHFVPIMKKRIELLANRYRLSSADVERLIQILGFDPNTREIIPGGTMFIARQDTKLLIKAFLLNIGIPKSKVRGQLDQIFNVADEQVELGKHIRPFPEVPGFLEKLKEHQVKIAIATHDTTAAALMQLALADIDRYVDLIIGLDYSEEILHKPAPSMLLIACNMFEISPKETIVVGDSINDVLMGINGGAGLSVGILTGEHKFHNFESYGALIRSIGDIKILE